VSGQRLVGVDQRVLGGPSRSVSGVRSSWLMLVKNAVFARSSSAERLGRAALGLIGARARDAGRDLARHEARGSPR
jgi:hypothetical protein